MIRSSCHPSAVIVGGRERRIESVRGRHRGTTSVCVCVCVCLKEEQIYYYQDRCATLLLRCRVVCVCMFEREASRQISIKIEVSPYSFGVGKCGCVWGGGVVTLTYLYSCKTTELVMMVFLPSYNIGHPIYIRRTGRKLWQFCKKIPTPLSAFANKAFPRSSFSPTR